MKFPYGLADFSRIVQEGYFYVDRTALIEKIEKFGENLLFLRPRRFGKSLIITMLENYYDLARADAFEKTFGHLAIGKNPTPLHNRYFVLKWDFSCVNPRGSIADIERSLFDHINARIRTFGLHYQHHLPKEIIFNPNNPLDSFTSLLSIVVQTSYKLYLLIDEYDNFANEVMMGGYGNEETYRSLVQKDGPLKTIFKAVKSALQGEGLERIFITGVSPILMSDITSGFNIAEDIYLEEKFHSLCGFSESEIRATLAEIVQEKQQNQRFFEEALAMMRTFYNGYRFRADQESLYNPTLALYFFKHFSEKGTYPEAMLDANLAPDESKLRYLVQIAAGNQMIIDLLQGSEPVEIPTILNRFKVEDFIARDYPDVPFLASLLYYFGILTQAGKSPTGKVKLEIPNRVIQKLYIDQMLKMLLPQGALRNEGVRVAELLYTKGEIEQLCTFVQDKLFGVFKNRDYRWMNEFAVKTAFFTLLYNDLLFMMDSEPELSRQYADLTMIIRPDMRKYQILDILIEFKYVEWKVASRKGKKEKTASVKSPRQSIAVQKKMEEAKAQIVRYKELLRQKHGEKLRLRAFAVVSLGFERIVWEEV